MGVSDKAVRKALAAGVFSDAAIRRDAAGVEVLNATLAVSEWEKSGRQLRGSTPPRPAASSNGDEMPAADPGAEIQELLARVRQLRGGHSAGAADDGIPVDDVPLAGGADSSPTLVKAQTEAVIERGRKLRMENDLREGALVEVDQASREAFEFSRVLRENILNIPLRLSAELAAEPDATRVHLRLEAALREALEGTAARLEAGSIEQQETV